MAADGFCGRFADLIEPLPAATRQGRREALEPEALGRVGGRLHAQSEAGAAARAALGFVLEPLHGPKPELVIVVAVDEGNPEFAAVAHALVLANVVLIAREDVRIEEEHRRGVIVGKKPLQNGGRTGRAAAVQKNGRRHGMQNGKGGRKS